MIFGCGVGSQRLVFLLVVGLPRLLVVRRQVVVEDVRVVENERAKSRHRDDAGGRHVRGDRSSRGARRAIVSAVTPAGRRAAHPEQVAASTASSSAADAQYAWNTRTRSRKWPKPFMSGIHVGGVAPYLYRLCSKPTAAREADDDEVHDHDEVTEVLLVHQRMHGQRQHADEPVVDELDAEQALRSTARARNGGSPSPSGCQDRTASAAPAARPARASARAACPANGSHVGIGSASWIWSRPMLALAPGELPA